MGGNFSGFLTLLQEMENMAELRVDPSKMNAAEIDAAMESLIAQVSAGPASGSFETAWREIFCHACCHQKLADEYGWTEEVIRNKYEEYKKQACKQIGITIKKKNKLRSDYQSEVDKRGFNLKQEKIARDNYIYHLKHTIKSGRVTGAVKAALETEIVRVEGELVGLEMAVTEHKEMRKIHDEFVSGLKEITAKKKKSQEGE